MVEALNYGEINTEIGKRNKNGLQPTTLTKANLQK